MSKLFFDDIITFERISVVIGNTTQSEEERHELWKVVDDIVYHEVLHFILAALDEKHHAEFANMIQIKPYDSHIIQYVSYKTGRKIKSELKRHLKDLEQQILESLLDK